MNITSTSDATVRPSDATGFSYDIYHIRDIGTGRECQKLIATWTDVQYEYNTILAFVSVDVRLWEDEKTASMKINANMDSGCYQLRSVIFPNLYIQPIDHPSIDKFVFPLFGGYLIQNPIENLLPSGGGYPEWLSMQLFAYYDDSGLLYIDIDDNQGYYKE